MCQQISSNYVAAGNIYKANNKSLSSSSIFYFDCSTVLKELIVLSIPSTDRNKYLIFILVEVYEHHKPDLFKEMFSSN